ncbi:DUF4124 domain-containing protein [Derxia lacustris]|uniref:DUF4124 domain-containing protein n=1 Tax=Derxia lacustris TaxID=764842 RepID=UPI000A1707A7|nr:DUF4124 domain-containing protein [Derxia lacustris]
MKPHRSSATGPGRRPLAAPHRLGAGLLLAALAAATPALAQFKYVDEKGVTVYSDRPPPANARTSQPIELGKGAQPADAGAGLPYALAQAVRKAPVTLYTQASCAPCDQGRSLLLARGVPFTERTLSTRDDLDAFRKLGFDDFLPAVMIGATRLVNIAPEQWQAALDSAGYPKTSQLPRSWRNPAPAPLVEARAQPVEPAAAPAAATPEPAPATPAAAVPATPPGFRF